MKKTNCHFYETNYLVKPIFKQLNRKIFVIFINTYEPIFKQFNKEIFVILLGTFSLYQPVFK